MRLMILFLATELAFPQGIMRVQRRTATQIGYTDNFNRADGEIGSNWTTLSGSFSVESNQVHGSGGASYSKAYWSANAVSADQWSQATITPSVNCCGGGVMVRVQDINTYYRCSGSSDGGVTLYYSTNGLGENVMGTSGNLVNGDVLRIEVIGTSVTCKKNGVTIIGPVTDSHVATGQPGLFSQWGNTVFDDWSGGPL